ncbi:forkhead box protein H1-like [Puntigrus tetrazona]|uniref:forkhead box protein H1-like n=1 Tax=Puntigrus tetrazona TaxID=1606681 RepID=UPI001C899AB5|nr:forkhead box protein H1-like [Puntigrus tetrazona]
MLSETDMLVRRKYKRYSKHKITYLGLIAYIIWRAPEKKLTFYELMNAVTIFVDGDRKGLENNIRVCLSSNKCFVKVPINPGSPNAKRNFWRVDESEITPKILRRHFGGLRHVSPAKNETETGVITREPPAAEKKFSGPFSIESLLRRENGAPSRITPGTGRPENAFGGLTNFDWPRADFTRSYSHVYFPIYSLGQTNEACGRSSGSFKKMHSVSEASYRTAPESISPFNPAVARM